MFEKHLSPELESGALQFFCNSSFEIVGSIWRKPVLIHASIICDIAGVREKFVWTRKRLIAERSFFREGRGGGLAYLGGVYPDWLAPGEGSVFVLEVYLGRALTCTTWGRAVAPSYLST